MLKWVIGSSLKYRFLVMAVAGGLMFFGAQQLRHTQVDVFPEFAPPRVEIQTPSLGLSATEVESLVTIPLEQSLAGVPGLDELRSTSVEGLSYAEIAEALELCHLRTSDHVGLWNKKHVALHGFTP